MRKHELREQRLSETTHYKKESSVNAIWAICTILVIVANILGSATKMLDRTNRISDFFHTAAYSIDNFFRTYAATSALYLILWGMVMLVLYLIAKKPDKVNIIVMKTVLFLLIISIAFSFMMLISENYYYEEEREPAFFKIFDILYEWLFSKIEFAAIVIMLIVFELIYIGVKYSATRILCSDKSSIRLRFLHGMPVCYCTEAFTSWQTVGMYLAPFMFINSVLYILNIRSENWHIVSGIFMGFISSFDMAVVIYTLHYKNKNKPDYISIDYHIHEATLFQR